MKEKTLLQHAKEWWAKQGKELPPIQSAEGKAMYEKWATWTFKDLKSKFLKKRARKED